MLDGTPENPNIPAPPDGSTRGALVPVTEREEDISVAKRIFPKVSDYVRGLSSAIYDSQSAKRLEKLRAYVKFCKFYEGHQIGFVNKAGKWVDKNKQSSGLYCDPALATFIDVIAADIAKSNPTIKITAKSEIQIDKREGARFAEELYKDARKDIFSPQEIQREAKYGFLMGGESYRHTFYNQGKIGKTFLAQTFEDKEFKSEIGFWICADCGAGGEKQPAIDEFPTEPTDQFEPDAKSQSVQSADLDADGICDNCGNRNIQEIEPFSINLQIPSGYETRDSGDVDSEFVSPMEMTVYGARDDISGALVVIRDRMLPRCVLEHLYPDRELSSDAIPDAMQYAEALNRNRQNQSFQTGAHGDTSAITEFELLHYRETWFSPSVYHGYIFPEDETLANGQKAAKGSKLIEMFPSGLYVAQVGKSVVDKYEQVIGKVWSHAVNNVSSDFHGTGENDLIPLQEQKNEIRTMQMQKIRHDSFSPILYKPQLIQGGKFPNKAGATIPLVNVDNDKDIDTVAKRLNVPPIQGEVFAVEDKISSAMQSRSGAFAGTSEALPDFKGVQGTLGGMQLWQEHVVGRRGQMLQNRADMEKEQAYQILEHRQKYWMPAAYEQIERRVGADSAKWFRKLDIRRDLNIETVADSWMPQTESRKRADFNEFLQIILPLSGQDPKIVKKLREMTANIYGRGLDVENFASDQAEAERRLEKLRQIASYIEQKEAVSDVNGLPLPQYVAIVFRETATHAKVVQIPGDPFANYPLDMMLDVHEQFAEFYSEWLRSSEGQRSSMFIRTCVRELVNAHRNAKTAQAQEVGRDAQLMELPMLESELAQNDAMHEQEMQHQAQNAELQHGLGQAQTVSNVALAGQLGQQMPQTATGA